MATVKRVALVTGGSRGIGRAIVEALARDGLRVAVNYHKHIDDARSVVEAVNAVGGEAFAIQADIGSAGEIDKTVKSVMDRFGRIDVLVNNAGVHIPGARLGDMRAQDWDWIIGVNLTAPFRLIQAVLPHMRVRKSGHIVNLSSNVTQRLPASFGAYAVSKVGVEALTRILAKEEGANGIRVNAVAPGPINTDMFAETRQVMGPERAQAFINSVPLGRMGDPSEIAAVVRFLVSDAASYVTGQTVFVNGGGPGG